MSITIATSDICDFSALDNEIIISLPIGSRISNSNPFFAWAWSTTATLKTRQTFSGTELHWCDIACKNRRSFFFLLGRTGSSWGPCAKIACEICVGKKSTKERTKIHPWQGESEVTCREKSRQALVSWNNPPCTQCCNIFRCQNCCVYNTCYPASVGLGWAPARPFLHEGWWLYCRKEKKCDLS